MIPLFKVAMSTAVSEALAPVLASGYIGEGPQVEAFEHALGEYLGAPVLAVNSCTSALDLAYELIGLGPGDEVIATPMTCLATNLPLAKRGCRIVWADVNPRTGNIDPDDVRRKLTPHTRAIVCVDWAGVPCDYDALRAAAQGAPIVEDAAHAFGARYRGQSVTAIGGDYVAYSFQAIKHLTCGDGGALCVPPEQYDRARLLRWYGLDRTLSQEMRCKQELIEAGFKYHMNDIAATIGLVNLPAAVYHLAWHRRNAADYSRLLPVGYTAPYQPDASYWLYTIHVPERDAFVAYMAGHGVAASEVHVRNDTQPCFNAERLPLPGLDAFSETQVSIPCGWWLSATDIEWIVGLVRRWAAEHSTEVRHASVPA